MSERGSVGTSEREQLLEIIFYVVGFYYYHLVLILSLQKLQGFLLYGFPEENIYVSCLLWLIVVHVILLDKILDHID